MELKKVDLVCVGGEKGKNNCWMYKGEEENLSDIEAIFTFFPFRETKRYVIIANRYVPVISLFTYGKPNTDVYDEDIAFNIIPQLEKKGVSCLVIDFPQKEFNMILEQENICKKRQQFDVLSSEMPDQLKVAREIFLREVEEAKQEEFIEEIAKWPVVIKNGFLEPGNVSGKYINYKNGERCTINNDNYYENTCFLFGPCIVRGMNVSDNHTLGRYVKNYVGDDFYVKNCGGVWNGQNFKMRENVYSPGDIVIIFAFRKEPYCLNKIKVYSIRNVYKKIPNVWDNIWDHPYHGNFLAVQYIADEIGEILTKNYLGKHGLKKCEEISFGNDNYRTKEIIGEEVKEWLESVKGAKSNYDGKIGSVVMNCNPFTKGHRYLVEEAKKKVDVLYIFVLEEDKSFFKFEDRLEMVRLGVADMENVIVIASGKYIISTITLPGYFEKEDKPTVEFDATEDLEIFGGVIAKEFGIQIRFAGEEPKDPFTNRYNKYMNMILPKFCVEFCEIPRKELNGEIISASRVRECIKNRRYEEVRELVVPSVYDYLKKYF